MNARSIFLCCILCLAASAAQSKVPGESSLLKTKEYTLGEYHLDRRYESMMGPMKEKAFSLGPKNAGRKLWIKSLSVQVVGADGKPASPGYLCHAVALFKPLSPLQNLGIVTISAGLMKTVFPKGYALEVANDGGADVRLRAQAENDSDRPANVFFRITIGYLEDRDARRLGLRRLVTTSVFTLGPTYATGMHMPDHLSMGSKVLHFEVPPGVHVYRSEVPSSSSFLRNGRIQYIKMHLHPYGQSVELYDETARKTVWKGMARNVPGRDVLAWTDHYGGGGDGLQIYKDHKYQVITTYDNTTRKPVDAMGNLRVYFEGTRPVSAIRQAPHD